MNITLTHLLANTIPVLVIIAVAWLGGYLLQSWKREDKENEKKKEK